MAKLPVEAPELIRVFGPTPHRVSIESLLSGAMKALVPAAAASTVLFCVNAGLLRYVFRFDRQIRDSK